MKLNLIIASMLTKYTLATVYCYFSDKPYGEGNGIPAYRHREEECDTNFVNVFNDRTVSVRCKNDESRWVDVYTFADAECKGEVFFIHSIAPGETRSKSFWGYERYKISSWNWYYNPDGFARLDNSTEAVVNQD